MRLIRILAALAGERLKDARGSAYRRAVLGVMLGLCALCAAGFAGALALVFLARWLGVAGALGVALALALAGVLGFWLAIRAEARRARLLQQARGADQARLLRLSLLLLLPKAGRTVAVLGVFAVLAALLMSPRNDPDP